ncbi:MAG: hypothetical protein WBN75_18280 [Verrucomicrobiia bacterium]|jgi:hypothetical protein
MSLIDTARDALKDLPISDIVRERLSLALDRLTEAEAKIEALQSENGGLKVQLENERLDHHQTKEQLQRLLYEHSEEVVIHSGIEFRRGKRTRSKWMAFCPVCHVPADVTVFPKCPNTKCQWQPTVMSKKQFEVIQSSLNG